VDHKIRDPSPSASRCAQTRQLQKLEETPLPPGIGQQNTDTFPFPRLHSGGPKPFVGAWRRTWDLDIRTLPRQNRHLSSCRFRVLFRYSADLQWPVRICAAVRASALLALSMRDFLGGGRGISSVPWWEGPDAGPPWPSEISQRPGV